MVMVAQTISAFPLTHPITALLPLTSVILPAVP